MTFDLEPNPFERSFADKKDPGTKNNGQPRSGSNKHDLQIPNISNIDATNQKLPGITPPLLTPGGRKLPPLTMSGHMLNPGTPGINLWNSLLTATSHHDGPQGQAGTVPAPGANHASSEEAAAAASVSHQGQANDLHDSNPQYNQFVTNLRNSGLTPNESNLRSGLTPGGINQPGYQFAGQVQYLNNPGMLANPMTPGLSSLLGYNQIHPEEVQNTSGETQANNSTQNPSAGVGSQIQQVAQPPLAQEARQENAKKSPPKRKASVSEKQQKRKKAEDSKPATKTESSSDKASESQNENEDKRKVFLERNRVAASKCRKRKKQLMVKMEEELAFYSAGYRNLSSQVTQIRDQLVNLRGVIVAHKDCPKLAATVGGFEELQSVLQETNYVIQMTSRSGVNTALMPTTIPTTLNPTQEAEIRSTQPLPSSLPGSVAPHHIGGNQDEGRASTRGSSDTIPTEASAGITPTAGGHPISSHHSLTDLPAASHASMQNMQLDANHGGDLRTINSMSNLTAMGRQPTAFQNGGFRPAASMVDLGQLNEQHLAQHNFNVDQRGYVGLTQSQS